MLKILFYLNRGFLKRHFFPTAPGALKSAAKICMYKTGLAFFLLLGRSGAGRGRAFRGRRDGASRQARGALRGRGSGRARPGWRPDRRAPGTQECAGCCHCRASVFYGKRAFISTLAQPFAYTYFLAFFFFFSPPAFCVAKNLNPSYFCNSLQNQAEN